ncbi:MAG TPA: bifunctional 5,6,7,8-tetrahydromethanopterin hydro-lyase/3-hexulose-6-phosphate synthase [Methanothermococcus okinawensis]|uniref:Bifunctional 5,6,7,8-tetrahydromethanopterin hydro-lyase/3-hexulose-6-phosphate synthase n=1 Tax=Methanothermococcus okinawensis TaxID=155863 RepID=A0A832ZCH9_9EURY|nr:bifunctional 5,6,7,8-tetrahydromethanopterin hydro-lyase/3-hexulose-6-phosphate synthase [Methanothermococcus okinawensis]
MLKFGEGVLGRDIVALVNLVLGKGEKIDSVFTNALTRVPTPVVANLRDNLIVKPLTLVVPRNTLTSDIQCNFLHGPIQYGVAKAVADLDLPEDLKLIVTVAVPDVPYTNLNKRKLFQYYYGATRLAINRALNDYPSKEKIKEEKYRAIHPLVGFRDIRLERPPYLQLALDVPSMENVEYVLESLPPSDKIVVEAGTPLIKRYGVEVVERIREIYDGFIVADLKTLDTGRVEVRMAFESTANAVVLSGTAPRETILKGIHECERCGMISYLDTINVKDPFGLYNSLELKPDVLLLHRAIDEEGKVPMREYRGVKGDKGPLLGIAGGVTLEKIEELKNRYHIIVVGRGITKAKDPGWVVRAILNKLGEDIDYRLPLEEDEDVPLK